MIEELMKRCERLPLEEKTRLRDFLTRSIEDTKGRSKSVLRGSILLGEMGKIFGREITYFNRDSWDVWARAMVAYQMLQEGYSTGEVGRQLMKDHSTVIHLRKKVEDMLSLPQAYRDITPVWEQFQKQIEL